MPQLAILAFFGGSLLTTCLPAAAQTTTFTVGQSTSGNADTPDPFGTAGFFDGFTYQQIYAASAFPGGATVPIPISSLGFASAAGDGNVPESLTYNLTVSLGNTSATTTNPSANFATNRSAANFIQVFNGNVTANLTDTGNFDLVIPVSTTPVVNTPFLYSSALLNNPNLLLQVVVNSETPLPINQVFFVGDDTQQTGSIFDRAAGGTSGTDVAPNNGLVTEFNAPLPTPEPAPALVLALGMAGLGALALRARRRA